LDKGSGQLIKAVELEEKAKALEAQAVKIAEQEAKGIEVVEKVRMPNPKIAELTKQIDELVGQAKAAREEGERLVREASAGAGAVKPAEVAPVAGKYAITLDAELQEFAAKIAHDSGWDKFYELENTLKTTGKVELPFEEIANQPILNRIDDILKADPKGVSSKLDVKDGSQKIFDLFKKKYPDKTDYIIDMAKRSAASMGKDKIEFTNMVEAVQYSADDVYEAYAKSKLTPSAKPLPAPIPSLPIDTTVSDLLKQGNTKLSQAADIEKQIAKLRTQSKRLTPETYQEVKRIEAEHSVALDKAASINSEATKLLEQAAKMRESSEYTPKQIQTIMDLGLKYRQQGESMIADANKILTANVKEYRVQERILRQARKTRRMGKSYLNVATKIAKWREEVAQGIIATAERAGAYGAKAQEMAVDPLNELALSLEEAKRTGKNIVNLRDWLEENRGEVAGAEWLIGKIGKNADVMMDEDAVLKFVEMADAQRRWESPEWQNWFTQYRRFWVNNVLFIQLRGAFNNLFGDMWQRTLEGMEPRYATGFAGYQITASEGEIIKGMPFGMSGLADNAVLDYDVYGKPLYVGQMRHEYKIMDVREGFYGGPTYQKTDKMGYAVEEASTMGKATQEFVKKPSVAGAAKIAKEAIPSAGEAIKSGGIPVVRRLYRTIEENGRISTYVWFRKQGYSMRDAYEKVMEVHFPYSEMNDKMRAAMPFYFWNMKNIVRQSKYWMKKPGLMQTPFKIGMAIDERNQFRWSSDEDRSDYLKGASSLITFYKGKPIYLDYSNIFPPAAAESIIGALNSDSPMDAMQEILDNVGSLSGPEMKTVIEEIYNETLFTHQPIRDSFKGYTPERGISQLWGIDISGNRLAQTFAHIINNFFPVPTSIQQLKKAVHDQPGAMAALKMMFGVPFRVDDPVLATFVEMNGEIGHLSGLMKKKQKEYDIKLGNAPKAETDKIYDEILNINNQMATFKARQGLAQQSLIVLKNIKYQIIIAKEKKDMAEVKRLEQMMEDIYNQYKGQINQMKQQSRK
jgi:hypothetical protein